MEALSIFTIAAIAAWLGVYALRRWATRRQMLDRPNDRSMHTAATPTGGGLAIAAVCLIGLFLSRIGCAGDVPAAVVVTFAAGAILIAAVSWIDDLRPLGAGVRLSVHMLAAAALLWVCSLCLESATGFQTANSHSQDTPPLALGILGILAAFFWLVGMTNAYNFMDGVDGMAAAVAVVAGLSWFALAALCGATTVGSLGLLLAAASGGFLLHNRPPARIFMGDVGSAFLGFSFGSLVLIAAMVDRRLAIAGGLLVWPFVFDTLSTFLRRLLRGENVLAAHRQHLYQRLCLVGWTHGSVTLFYAFLTATGAIMAAAILVYPVAGSWAAAAVLPLLTAGLWIFGRLQTTAWDYEEQHHQEWPCENEPALEKMQRSRERLEIETRDRVTTEPDAKNQLQRERFESTSLGAR